MARVTVTRQWPDDDGLRVEVTVAESFPDAVDEAVNGALRAYREALGLTVSTFEPEADGDVV